MKPVVITFLLLVAYGWGVWKFWKGYDRTNFQASLVSKVTLALFWPALLIVNKSYRKNFQKALRG
jgi:hypothetical protein